MARVVKMAPMVYTSNTLADNKAPPSLEQLVRSDPMRRLLPSSLPWAFGLESNPPSIDE